MMSGPFGKDENNSIFIRRSKATPNLQVHLRRTQIRHLHEVENGVDMGDTVIAILEQKEQDMTKVREATPRNIETASQSTGRGSTGE